MYRNLIAEIARKGLTNKIISSALEVDRNTFENKLKGKTKFSFDEAQSIRNTFFPEYQYDYLFTKFVEAD